MTQRALGRLTDGTPITCHRLGDGDGLVVEILDYGATVRSLRIVQDGVSYETLVGFESIEAYESDRKYIGCVVGRTVNRIAGAGYTRDGVETSLSRNDGPHNLHGGVTGLSRKVWSVAARTSHLDDVVMSCASEDGEDGFPGHVEFQVRFSLPDPLALRIDYFAVSDRETPLDMTHHLYVNLDPGPPSSIDRHTLTIAASGVLELDPEDIPTGKIFDVGGTPFDLRTPRKLGEVGQMPHPQMRRYGFNHNWVLNRDAAPALSLSADMPWELQLETDQPGLQIYSGLPLDVCPAGAIAIEPQGFPNAVNCDRFPSPFYPAGQAFRRTTTYRYVQR